MSWGHLKYNKLSLFQMLNASWKSLDKEGWIAWCKSQEVRKGGIDGMDSCRNKGTRQEEKKETIHQS